MKIFVSAYACEPGLGSEIGVGWHWVLEMSRYFELWVLTRESNRHTIEPWIANHPEFANIHFVYFDLPKWVRFWKKGLRGVRTYYNIWQRLTNRIVKRTMQQNGITVFHHLTYGNALWPVSSYGSKQTFIWGPIGGLETIPEDFSKHYGRKERLIEKIRRIVVSMNVKSRAFRKRCERADLILCKTDITRQLLPASVHDRAIPFTDVAPDITDAVTMTTVDDDHGTLKLITVGRLDAWRGFDLAIEALAQAKVNAKLVIVGKGADKERLKALAEEKGIAHKVIFAGKIDMNEYKRLMAEADVVVNAALKEGAVTVSFDAMAMGKPLLALDSTGYTRYFKPEFSILVPIEDRATVVANLARGIERLTDSSVRQSMGNAAIAAAKQYNWHLHGLEIKQAIESVVNKG